MSKDINDSDLNELFSEFGKVREVKIVRDMFTQESKGFGFVEMYSQNEGNVAIEKLNVTEYHGKMLVVNRARPEKRRGKRR